MAAWKKPLKQLSELWSAWKRMRPGDRTALIAFYVAAPITLPLGWIDEGLELLDAKLKGRPPRTRAEREMQNAYAAALWAWRMTGGDPTRRPVPYRVAAVEVRRARVR